MTADNVLAQAASKAAIMRLLAVSYLVSAYFSAAVQIPDALGVLENVELGH